MDYERLFVHMQAIWYDETQSIWRILENLTADGV